MNGPPIDTADWDTMVVFKVVRRVEADGSSAYIIEATEAREMNAQEGLQTLLALLTTAREALANFLGAGPEVVFWPDKGED